MMQIDATVFDSLSDLGDQAARLLGYQRRCQQQGRGEFRGQSMTRQLSDQLTIFLESCNLRLFQRAVVPQSAHSLHFLFAAKAPCILNGQRLN
jgi:hypothetical protein